MRQLFLIRKHGTCHYENVCSHFTLTIKSVPTLICDFNGETQNKKGLMYLQNGEISFVTGTEKSNYRKLPPVNLNRTLLLLKCLKHVNVL